MNFSTYFQLPQTGQIFVTLNNKKEKVDFTKLGKGLMLLKNCEGSIIGIYHYSSIELALRGEPYFCDFEVVRFNEQVTRAKHSYDKFGYSICQDDVDTYEFLEGAKLAVRRLLLQDTEDNHAIENFMQEKGIADRTKDVKEQKLRIFLHEKEASEPNLKKITLSFNYSFLAKNEKSVCLEMSFTEVINKKASLEVFILKNLFEFIHNVCKDGYFYENDIPLINLLKGLKDKEEEDINSCEIAEINRAIKELNIFTALTNKEIEKQKLKINKLTKDLLSII